MNKIQVISNYRTQLMGIAILWIMLFHTNNDFGWRLFKRMTDIGYGGVDIFLFISGFGLYYACQKKITAAQFYKKRFFRIFPAYILILLLVEIFTQSFSLNDYLIKLTTIGFWLPFAQLPFFTWYIPAILMLYLIFPPYIKWFNKKPIQATTFTIIIGILMSSIYSFIFTEYYPEEKNHLMLFTSRIPIFFIGVYFGMLSLRKSVLTHNQHIICILIFFIGIVCLFFFIHKFDYWVLRNIGLFYYPFILITPGLCLLLGQLLSFTPLFINKILIFIGSISLEIYLIHETLFLYNKDLMNLLHCSASIGFIILIAMSILLGYLVSNILKYSSNFLNKKFNHKYSINNE